MKMPNGYGSVTKLKGNRRKPWMVRISGKTTFNKETMTAKQERFILGYYTTRQDKIVLPTCYQ